MENFNDRELKMEEVQANIESELLGFLNLEFTYPID